MDDERGAVGTETPGQRAERIDRGLGTTRYKEYELAGYAQIVRARVPQEIWTGVFWSWASLKGHLQGLNEFDRTQFFATVADDETVDVTFVVVWQGAESLAEWLENGFSTEEMLLDMGIPEADIDVRLMRDFS